MQGVKFDEGKAPMHLLDRYALEQIAQVLGFGAKKYSPDNWRNGIATSRLISSALRHIHAWNDGESLDPESGMSHLSHAACCLMFGIWMEAYRPDMDDRFGEDAGDVMDWSANPFADSNEFPFCEQREAERQSCDACEGIGDPAEHDVLAHIIINILPLLQDVPPGKLVVARFDDARLTRVIYGDNIARIDNFFLSDAFRIPCSDLFGVFVWDGEKIVMERDEPLMRSIVAAINASADL